MARSSEQSGSNLEQVLAAAIADLIDRDIDEVSVVIRADGLDALASSVRVHLEVEGSEEEDPSVTAHEPAADATDDGGSDERIEDVKDAEDEDGVSADPGARTQRSAPGERLTEADIDAEADAAADFLEGLLDALDLPGDLRINVHPDHAAIELIDIGSGALIGRRGQTLEAIQELVRCSLQRQFQRRSRVMIDAEGYRARRLEKLLEKADEAIDTVLDTGEPERLEPMDVFERKAVHHLVAEVDGVASRSQGREPGRRIIIEPA